MRDLNLKVGGKVYGGWLAVRVRRSLEEMAGAFALDVTERWSKGKPPGAIQEGSACVLEHAGNTLITGWIDESTVGYSSTERTMSVAGRSKAGDLVDCSAKHASGSWVSTTVLVIARELVAPFGIKVEATAELTALPKFALSHGETVFEALERAARMSGVLVTSTDGGSIVFTRAGGARTKTVLTRPTVLTGERRASWRERFSEYTVKGQSAGDDDTSGAAASQQMAVETDPAITRYRPLIVLAEDQANTGAFAQRATWERNVRRGRARRLAFTVQGWTNAEGPWAPNTIVRVSDDWLAIDEDLLVVSATQVLDAEGARTELELTAAAAYDVEPLPAETAGEGG